jgi:hypothetical protein
MQGLDTAGNFPDIQPFVSVLLPRMISWKHRYLEDIIPMITECEDRANSRVPRFTNTRVYMCMCIYICTSLYTCVFIHVSTRTQGTEKKNIYIERTSVVNTECSSVCLHSVVLVSVHW